MAIEPAGGNGDVLRRMKRRDGRAVAQLYDRYGRLVYALIFRMVRNQVVAEDLVQETFLRVWSRAQIFDEPKCAMGPWLLAAARNRALDYLRSQEGSGSGLAVCEENEAPRFYAGPEAGVSFAEQTRRAKQALAQLPEDQRQAIELACFDCVSPTGIAAKSGHPPGTVETWLHGALALLRQAMEAGVAE
jgi:RNA polymerase sigma-70 factor (ECF subfamily)